jgi:hypothetical protein
MFTVSLHAKLNVAGGIYIRCNISTVFLVQMRGILSFYTMYLTSIFLTFQRNKLLPTATIHLPEVTPFLCLPGWGLGEGNSKNSQLPCNPSLSYSCDGQILSNVTT